MQRRIKHNNDNATSGLVEPAQRLITMKEFASLIGMSEAWLFAQKKANKLPAAVCLGRARRYRLNDVQSFIEQHLASKEA